MTTPSLTSNREALAAGNSTHPSRQSSYLALHDWLSISDKRPRVQGRCCDWRCSAVVTVTQLRSSNEATSNSLKRKVRRVYGGAGEDGGEDNSKMETGMRKQFLHGNLHVYLSLIRCLFGDNSTLVYIRARASKCNSNCSIQPQQTSRSLVCIQRAAATK